MKASAVERPIPRAPPVIAATWPAMLRGCLANTASFVTEASPYLCGDGDRASGVLRAVQRGVRAGEQRVRRLAAVVGHDARRRGLPVGGRVADAVDDLLRAHHVAAGQQDA